ncbi:MAG: hypothetical protein K0R54_275 [Clostridiaceae bacterium]|jgi:hypothetical protein|nr:hypothetical protein [Clostridiaceae bacterium]
MKSVIKFLKSEPMYKEGIISILLPFLTKGLINKMNTSDAVTIANARTIKNIAVVFGEDTFLTNLISNNFIALATFAISLFFVVFIIVLYMAIRNCKPYEPKYGEVENSKTLTAINVMLSSFLTIFGINSTVVSIITYTIIYWIKEKTKEMFGEK